MIGRLHGEIEQHTLWIFAGWLRVSFGSDDASVEAWEWSSERVAVFEAEFSPWAWVLSGVCLSPSTKNRESKSGFGNASGASVSSKILSEDTCKSLEMRIIQFFNMCNTVNTNETDELTAFSMRLAFCTFMDIRKPEKEKYAPSLANSGTISAEPK